ncbi:hypothetical protein TVAG_303810 [Trichomonas vaginalis G3]|uniref:Uncharacterized protein n=1 Tax=Trichomonas vaginalis (strain ATCC PRA-98 / G3) TaxID=412133 RepID=A2DR63_TRIV3|nr:guanylate cyclase protein [Trichomonas vaginalis G3]EAY17162.1 hypothetical protein TVAG_303810 [Trichomonas vaginalis G3]KAI5508892.1 guanylate cyclase protein [Trichomonas vaginalis G3]|eukprot:XP_001329385.1 hypothetical protein [Trichomonas vaginalis G3]
MQETAITASSSLQDISNSENTKLEQLIDVPFTKKAIAALLRLFNYFDIYAPRIPAVYDIITIIRFFQLIGGSIMAANTDLFKPGTLTFKVMSVISVLFHVVPVQYRDANLVYILTAIDAILIVFGFYLVITVFQYKTTSKVPRMSLLILSFYIAIGPFIILPLAAQFVGQMISNEIATASKPDSIELILAIVTVTQFVFYIWMMMKTYTTTIIFRATSLQTLEGSAQNKVFLVTLFNTLICAIATDMDRIPQTVITAISMLIYVFSITTVFNCGTFIRHSHQIMILGGSILGIVISAVNFCPAEKQNQ